MLIKELSKYHLFEKCNIKNASKFFIDYLYSKTYISFIFFSSVILGIIAILLSIIDKPDFNEVTGDLGLAMFIFIPYISIHEVIHLLCYKLFGCNNSGIRLQRGMIYSYCHKFIFTGNQYKLCALMPVILTSMACLISYIVHTELKGIIAFFFLFQLYGSHMDIAIANYCTMNKGILFYSDINEGCLYFYKENGNR